MPSRHFLNALRPGTATLPPPDPGVWRSHLEFLRDYANSVDIQGQLPIDSIAHSTPSVFRRPIQFFRAMSDETNPLHKAFTSEWRGLMAVFGLSEWLDLRLEVKEFGVPEVHAGETSSVGNEACGDLHFRAMLRNQMPMRPGPADGPRGEHRLSDFRKWWMIRCSGQLLGATSPWSVVYTASQYRAPSSIPWQRGGLLVDPLLHYMPKPGQEPAIELSILYAWVTQLLDARASWDFPAGLLQYANLLSLQLQSWQRDLSRSARPDLVLTPGRSLITVPPFAAVLRAPSGLQQDDSDVYLDTEQGRVLVLYDEMPPDTRVHRGVFADRIDVARLRAAEGPSFLTTDGSLVSQPYIVPKKLFFPDRLVRIALSGDALRPGNTSVPLEPSFFRYLTYRELPGLSVTELDGEVTATLRLVLRSRREISISRTYSREDVITLDSGNPALALWPSSYDVDWKQSFAGFAYPGTELIVNPLLAGGTVSPDAGEGGHGQRDVRLWHLPTPAIGFALRVTTQGRTGAGLFSAGVVLRRDLRPPTQISVGRRWRIGVDFGTSSTTVMVDEGDGRVREMPFHAHLLALVEPSQTAGRQAEIARNLYPQESVTPPFRTLLYKATETATIFGATAPFTLRFSSDVTQDIVNQPIEDLKWGMQERFGTNPLTAYLEALVRYVVWEARSLGVQDIEFSWSYPASLPKRTLSDMRQFWATLPQKHWHAGLNIDCTAGMSESEAACRSLTRDTGRVRVDVLSITVDVGGGSTDIAFWSHGEMLDQVSFKVAGNDVLDREYLNGATLAEFFRICSGRSLTAADLGKLAERPEIYVNGALSDVGGVENADPRRHPICAHIFGGGRAGAAPWLHFRSMAYLFFSGICYYMGTQARSFAIGVPEVDLYFGGRGSALLSWLSVVKGELDPALGRAFLTGLRRGTDDGMESRFPEGNPKITFSGQALGSDSRLPLLKTEVALGLLVQRDMKLSANGQKGTPAGETGWARKGSRIPWTERLQPEELLQVHPPDAAGFASTMIGHFLWDIFHADPAESLEALNLDAKHLQMLEVNGQDVLNLIHKSLDAGENVSQPIFAFELKSLMHQYARKVKP